MPVTPAPAANSIELSRLKPTQLTVGMLQVKQKRARLKALEKKPGELVAFILEHPIRVVLGPQNKAYVIDHHHLALALIKEQFETAPMLVEENWAYMKPDPFWKKMQAQHYVHLADADGKPKPLKALPKSVKHLQDDPYRSLAGFVREAGGFRKVPAPFAEFEWADFYRNHIPEKLITRHLKKAVQDALKLCAHKDAGKLPGYIKLNK